MFVYHFHLFKVNLSPLFFILHPHFVYFNKTKTKISSSSSSSSSSSGSGSGSSSSSSSSSPTNNNMESEQFELPASFGGLGGSIF